MAVGKTNWSQTELQEMADELAALTGDTFRVVKNYSKWDFQRKDHFFGGYTNVIGWVTTQELYNFLKGATFYGSMCKDVGYRQGYDKGILEPNPNVSAGLRYEGYKVGLYIGNNFAINTLKDKGMADAAAEMQSHAERLRQDAEPNTPPESVTE